MLRHCLLVFGLIAATNLSAGGCRSCSSCHDYSSPVAGCGCHSCDAGRCGSTACGCEEHASPHEPPVDSEEVYTESDTEPPSPQSFELPVSSSGPEMDQPVGVR
jgi:hypothetical protein